MQKILVNTTDGSNTFFVPELNEHYHSVNGAITESEIVFINNGLIEKINNTEKENIQVFETGLGTGLNALLTLVKSNVFKKKIYYTSIEPYPLTMDEINRLNYTSKKSLNNYDKQFKLFHSCNDTEFHQLGNYFYFKNLNIKLEEYYPSANCFDVIYFDAFSPAIQPEMWTEKVFEKMYNALSFKGILVTYCAKGSVKRILKSTGFQVESLPGPPGKREVVRAKKNSW